MIVIMTVIRSFGDAEDATMIDIIRVIILIIFMMIVIIVIAFIILIIIVIINCHHHHHLFLHFYIHFKCGVRHMIVIMTVIRSFGNAQDATMIVIIRVIILIIFMIVIIVITFIIVIMVAIIIIIYFFYLSSIYMSNVALGTLGNAEDATMIVIMTVIRSFGNAEDATMIVIIGSHHPYHLHDDCHHRHHLHHRHHDCHHIISFFYTFQMWL